MSEDRAPGDRAPLPPARDAAVTLRREEKADEWHFDENVHQAQVEKATAEAAANRTRETNAIERQKRTQREAEDRIAEFARAIAEDEQKSAREVAELRAQIQDEAERREDLFDECDEEVQRIQGEVEAVRMRRSDAEAALKEEKRQFDKAFGREGELEQEECRANHEKDERLRKFQTETQARIVQAQRASEARVREAENRMREEIETIQREMQKVLSQQQGDSTVEISQRQEAIQTAHKEVRSRVDTQVRQALNNVQKEAEDLHQDAYQQVKDIRAADYALETLLQQKEAAARQAHAVSENELHQAAVNEKLNKERVDSAVHVYGSVFARSTHFSLPGPPKKSLPPGPLGLSAQAIMAAPSSPTSARATPSPRGPKSA